MTAMARPALLYFLLWLGVTLSSAMNLEKRIIGGKPCGPKERLYHVKLIAIDTAGKKFLCGGSLIKDQWVLTAAHCWKTGGTMEAYVNFHPGPHEPPINVIDNKIYTEKGQTHDIMLVKLAKSPQKINTVGIPTQDQCNKNDIKDKEQYQMSGYEHGTDSTGKKELNKHDKLHCATLTADTCGADVKSCFPNIPEKNWICGKDTVMDAGGGDSGSGAVVGNVIYGVHSQSGPSPCVTTADALRVCPYLIWIIDTAK